MCDDHLQPEGLRERPGRCPCALPSSSRRSPGPTACHISSLNICFIIAEKIINSFLVKSIALFRIYFNSSTDMTFHRNIHIHFIEINILLPPI